MAIHFFFILSGYVQSFHYFKKPEISVVQKSFLKRYFRLAIPTLAIVILVYFFHRFHLINKHFIPVDPVTGGWSSSMMPNNLNFLQVIKQGLVDCFVRSFKYYQVLWTMPIELLNSWMVLILLFLTHELKHKPRVLIFWLIIQLFFIQSYYSAAFTFGMLICYAEISSEKFREIFSRPLVKFVCLIFGLYFASYPFIGYEKSTVQSMYAPISFFEKYPHIISYLFGDLLLFLVLLKSRRVKTLLSGGIFQFFGNISFMFYLLHLLIIFSFSPWLFHFLQNYTGRHTNLALTGIATFIVVSVGSHFLYTYVDKPVLKWCSIYSKKFFGI